MLNNGDLAKVHDVRTTHHDNIIFNCTFNNNTNRVKILDYASNRNTEVLKAGSMYYLIIDSFNIPNATLPIFLFDNAPYGVEDLIETSINPITVYRPLRIEIQYNTLDSFSAAILFKDYGDQEQLTSTGNTSYKIYQIEQFLSMVNQALADISNNAGVSDVEYYPRIEVSSTNGANIFQLVIPDNPAGGDPLIIENGITMSSSLYDYFSGLPAIFNGTYNSLNGRDYSIVSPEQDITDDRIIKQAHHSIYNWSDIQAILLLSSDLPINEENFTNFNNNGNDTKFKVIADFIPFQDEAGNIDRTDWRYNSDYPRLIDLRSNRGVINISFTVSILRKDNSISPLYIAPGKTANLKMRFVKRALYNNEYNISDFANRVNQIGLRNFHTKH